MPRNSTFPTLYEDLKVISISFLNKHGYLMPEQRKTGTLRWIRNGVEVSSISICVDNDDFAPYLELEYLCRETPMNYRVQLVSILSNLGNGRIWYFICPHTGKRCRKLHLANKHFYHRTAYRGCMYEKQTQSKKSRYLDKLFGSYYKTDQLMEELHKKHFKWHYAGKPTKKYLRIVEQLEGIRRP